MRATGSRRGWKGVAAIASAVLACGCYREVGPCGGEVCADGSAVRDGATGGEGGAVVSCTGQDAHGVGTCPRSVGVFWDGARCDFAWGCSCEGRDCGTPFHTVEACEEQHAMCP